MMDMKNFCLRLIGILNLLFFILGATMIDSKSWVPFIVCCATGSYLVLFAYANNWFERKR